MPVRMTSEKFIRAERRNQVENHLLGVHFKHIDRETVRLNYEIDREKRGITKSFKNVVKTSGISDVGLPPKNDNDRDFEKCATYRQGLKLSNKRLLEWRECEKQLNKFIVNHEKEMLKQSARRPVVKTTDNYVNGSSKQNEDKEEEDDDVFEESESVYSEFSPKTSPVDILKENPDDKEEVFDIKKWQQDIIESYKTMLCKHGTNDSVGESEANKTKDRLRSKSSPAISSEKKDNKYSVEKSKVRPHTANGTVRTRPFSATSFRARPSSATSLRSRPSSAKTTISDTGSPFLITKDSVYIRNGQKFKKFIDNRSVEQPVMINNYIDSSPTVTSEPVTAPVNGLCPVEEGNEDDPDGDESKPEVKSNPVAAPETSHKSFRGKHKSKRQRTTSVGTNSVASTRQSTFKHSNSDLSSYVESHRRKRLDSDAASSSIFSRPLSRAASSISVNRPSISLGIPADIEEISREQDKLVSEITPEKPLATNKLVHVSTIVKAAMTFSRLARTRALMKMQEENSSDGHEVIRQERLRRLQSRQNVLNSIANQWNSDSPDVFEQVE